MRDDATTAVSNSVLICIALTSGAMFGMASQTALHHFGLDLGSLHSDLIVDRVVQSRSAMAWWGWWVAAVASFFIGPFSVRLARYLIANWWLFRELRLFLSAVLVLGLAIIGHLPAAPLRLDVTAGAAVGAVVATLSALLSVLGARLAAARSNRAHAARTGYTRPRGGAPVRSPPPPPGGGSVNSGCPRPRSSTGHWLVPQPGRVARLALAGMLTLAAFAVVSTVAGVAVLLEVVSPPATRGLIVWNGRPAGGEVDAPAISSLLETAGERRNPVLPMSASGLTFAKGYVLRHAALDAAAKFGPATPKLQAEAVVFASTAMFGPVRKVDIKPAARKARRGVAALVAPRSHPHRQDAFDRRATNDRRPAYDRRPHDRYAYGRDVYDRSGHGRQAERHTGARSHRTGSRRHTTHHRSYERHRGHDWHRDRYRGYDHYARADRGHRMR